MAFEELTPKLITIVTHIVLKDIKYIFQLSISDNNTDYKVPQLNK